jgi:hypothetical protein
MIVSLYETKHSGFLTNCGDWLEEISGIECKGWSPMKLATSLKILCIPEDDIPHDDRELVNSNCSLVLTMCVSDGSSMEYNWPVACLFQDFSEDELLKLKIFFSKHTGQLCIFVLRGKEVSPIYNPAPLLGPGGGL